MVELFRAILQKAIFIFDVLRSSGFGGSEVHTLKLQMLNPKTH